MKNIRKLTAVLLAVVMMFAMNVSAFAATSDPNFTKSDNSAWSTAVTSGSSAVVKVGPADSSYCYTGFTSEADAEAIAVTANCNGNNFTYSVEGVEDTNHYGGSCWAAAITVTPVSGFIGPISIHCVPANAASAWTYVDMTIYVEPVSSTTTSNISVGIKDLVGQSLDDDMVVATLSASGDQANSPFNGSDGCAQKYPTAASALFALMGEDTIVQSEGYISSIDDIAENWTAGTGWNYCVIRDVDGTYVQDSVASVVSASVMPLQASDIVLWAFGTSTAAANYFAEYVDDLNAG